MTLSPPKLYRVYTIYDIVAEEAYPPFTAVNDGVALRQFRSAIGQSPNPSDFRLYAIGAFADKTMTLSSETPREIFTSEEE